MKGEREYQRLVAEAKALLEPEGNDTSDPGYRQYARGMVELITGVCCGSMEYKADVARDIGLDPEVVRVTQLTGGQKLMAAKEARLRSEGIDPESMTEEEVWNAYPADGFTAEQWAAAGVYQPLCREVAEAETEARD